MSTTFPLFLVEPLKLNCPSQYLGDGVDIRWAWSFKIFHLIQSHTVATSLQHLD